MNDSPRTGNGYSESESVKDDIELDMRMKKFQKDFVESSSPAPAKTIVGEKAMRKAKKWSPFI